MNDSQPIEPPLRGGEMSFLEHLEELRRRLVNSVIILILAFVGCWFASGKIYSFLSIPIRKALSEAERREVPIRGLTGEEKLLPLTSLNEGDTGRFVFDQSTNFGGTVISTGTSVEAIVAKDADGNLALYTAEPV